MQFLKCVKVALLVSGAAFTVASLPVAKFADERIDVQFNRAQIFSGQARDFAGAYLSIAGLVSVSLGMTGFSLAAWRQTRSRLTQTKQAVSELENLVKQREQQLQLAQLSPARVQQAGLQAFLEEDDLSALDFAPAKPPLTAQAAAGQAGSVNPAIPANQVVPVNQAVSVGYTSPMVQAGGYQAGGYQAGGYVKGQAGSGNHYAAAANPLPAPIQQPMSASQVAPADHAIASVVYQQQPLSRIPQQPPAALYPEQRHLSPSQAAQLQAVQAQLQQQHRQARQLPASRTTASRSNGFTVINPYQVQVAGHPGRQRHA